MERWSEGDFQGALAKRAGDWAVAFVADWCPFCESYKATLLLREGKTPFGLALADITDLESPLWEEFAIEIVPTLIAFRDGRPVARRDGTPGVGLGAHDLDRLAKEFPTRPR